MEKLKFLFYPVFFFLSINHLLAQSSKTFKWTDDCCEYSGTYDPAKVTEKQLKNTFDLFFWSKYSLQTNTAVFSLKDIAKLNIDSLSNEYARKTLQLTKLDIINDGYWEKFRKDVQTQMHQTFYLKRITIQAYQDPAVLLTFTTCDSCVAKYGKPLAEGGDTMLQAWKDLLEYQCSNNGYPERLRLEFDKMYNSPDQLKYARMELINFGWWNCAIRTIDVIDQTNPDPYAKFREAFIEIKELECGCD